MLTLTEAAAPQPICKRTGFHLESGRQEVRNIRSAGDTRIDALLEQCADCGIWASPGYPYFVKER